MALARNRNRASSYARAARLVAFLVILSGVAVTHPLMLVADAACPLETAAVRSSSATTDSSDAHGAPQDGEAANTEAPVESALIDPCLSGRSSGGGGGAGGDGKRHFVINDRSVAEEPDPLKRFTAFPVADLDAPTPDGVVELPPVPFDPLPPAEYVGAVVNATNANITALLGVFNFPPGSAAQQVYDLLKDDPRLKPTGEEARDLILRGAYTDAVDLVLSKATPAEIKLWCGTETHPLYVRWIVAIPAVVSCVPDGSAAAPMMARVPDHERQIVLNTTAQNDPAPGRPLEDTQISSIRVQFSVGGVIGATDRRLAGFTYANASVAVHTAMDHTWTIDSNISGLITHAPLRAATLFKVGLPEDILASGSFENGDIVHFGNGTFVTRGSAYWVSMNENRTKFNGTLLWREAPNSGSMQLFAQSATPVASKTGGATIETPGGISVRLVFGNLERGLRVFTLDEPRSLVVSPRRAHNPDGVKDSEQPIDIVSDNMEMRATAYLAGAPQATIQVVGIPSHGLAEIRFAKQTTDRPDVRGAQTNVKEQDASRHWFRTILITEHGGTGSTSVTGDYARRVILLAGQSGDPFGDTNKPWQFAAAYLYGYDWITLNGNDTREEAHFGMIEEADTDAERTPGARWAYISPTRTAQDRVGEAASRAIRPEEAMRQLYLQALNGYATPSGPAFRNVFDISGNIVDV